MADIPSNLVDLALPLTCSGCGRPDCFVCDACDRKMCRPLAEVSALAPALNGKLSVWTTQFYRGHARHLLLSAKHDRQRDMSNYLRRWGRHQGVYLSQEIRRPCGPVAVVAAPSSVTRRLQRRQIVPMVADGCAVGLADAGVAALSMNPLHLWGSGQAGKVGADRVSGRHNTMTCDVDLSQYAVVLVDDVITTGATIMECVRAIRTAATSPVHLIGAVSLCMALPFPLANTA